MKLRYMIFDIDGTLTDGGIYYDENGNELKKFNTKDGTGIILTHTANITPIVITGRACAATSRRMAELGVSHLYQGIRNKVEFLQTWMSENGVTKDEIGYIGDDLNDIGPMKLCGFVACPADAVDEVKEIADYVANVNGGQGVVRDVIKYLLQNEGIWEDVLNKAYGAGV